MDENREIRRIKSTNYTIFVVVLIVAALFALKLAQSVYWSSFSSEKWPENPERRAGMTADLTEQYELTGMSVPEVEALLGESDYASADSLVYWLGNERTLIDSEWLVLELSGGAVSGVSIETD